MQIKKKTSANSRPAETVAAGCIRSFVLKEFSSRSFYFVAFNVKSFSISLWIKPLQLKHAIDKLEDLTYLFI